MINTIFHNCFPTYFKDPFEVSSFESPVLILASFLLIITYIKVRKRKKSYDFDTQVETNTSVAVYQPKDVMMQTKAIDQISSGFVRDYPFSNYKIPLLFKLVGYVLTALSIFAFTAYILYFVV